MHLVSCPNCEQLPGDRINYVIASLLLLVILLVVITMQLGHVVFVSYLQGQSWQPI
jgi:uncharacterized integral membrane protein